MGCPRSSTSFTVSLSYQNKSNFLGMLSGICSFLKNFSFFIVGRTPDTSAVLQEKFSQFSLETGVLAENIVMLPKNGKLTVSTM